MKPSVLTTPIKTMKMKLSTLGSALLLLTTSIICNQAYAETTNNDCVSLPDPTKGAPTKPICDKDFYVAPSQLGKTYHLVNDFKVNNIDHEDDSKLLQKALNKISKQKNGGKLIIPAGKYYLLGVQMRSNVHIEVDENAVIYPTWKGDRRNHRIFEFGTFNNRRVENASIVGLGSGFTIDFRQSKDPNLAVFSLGDTRNFKISNIKIHDNRTIFASFLVGITKNNGEILWPHHGIIENITQTDSLFGYGIVQTYAADRILFRNLNGEGGIALRLETDHQLMKKFGKGGVREIYAENIHCENGLSAVMFGPHFQKNGQVVVNGVSSKGCGFTVRSDKGFVELFSPKGYTKKQWIAAIEDELGKGCVGNTYVRGRDRNMWASRINDKGNCLELAEKYHKLSPGVYDDSYVFNVKSIYGERAHLKQNQLDYLSKMNAECSNVCLPSKAVWPKRGQVYYGPSIAAVYDPNIPGRKFNSNIIVDNIEMIGYPENHHIKVTPDTAKKRVCQFYGVATCDDNKAWFPKWNNKKK